MGQLGCCSSRLKAALQHGCPAHLPLYVTIMLFVSTVAYWSICRAAWQAHLRCFDVHMHRAGPNTCNCVGAGCSPRLHHLAQHNRSTRQAQECSIANDSTAQRNIAQRAPPPKSQGRRCSGPAGVVVCSEFISSQARWAAKWQQPTWNTGMPAVSTALAVHSGRAGAGTAVPQMGPRVPAGSGACPRCPRWGGWGPTPAGFSGQGRGVIGWSEMCAASTCISGPPLRLGLIDRLQHPAALTMLSTKHPEHPPRPCAPRPRQTAGPPAQRACWSGTQSGSRAPAAPSAAPACTHCIYGRPAQALRSGGGRRAAHGTARGATCSRRSHGLGAVSVVIRGCFRGTSAHQSCNKGGASRARVGWRRRRQTVAGTARGPAQAFRLTWIFSLALRSRGSHRKASTDRERRPWLAAVAPAAADALLRHCMPGIKLDDRRRAARCLQPAAADTEAHAVAGMPL